MSVRGATLFTTTLPCHNCAKHIVDAGISRVFFVEPYPKSKALELHSDAVSLEPEPLGGRVQFSPFIGIGARRWYRGIAAPRRRGCPSSRCPTSSSKLP